MPDDALINLSEAIARRSTDEALNDYAFSDEPNSFYTKAPYKQIVDGYEPKHSYWSTTDPSVGETGAVPLSGGWEIPGTSEWFWGENDDKDIMSVRRRSLYPGTLMSQPQGEAMQMPGGGFDFGSTQSGMGPVPQNNEVNNVVDSMLPEKLQMYGGSSGTMIPAGSRNRPYRR